MFIGVVFQGASHRSIVLPLAQISADICKVLTADETYLVCTSRKSNRPTGFPMPAAKDDREDFLKLLGHDLRWAI